MSDSQGCIYDKNGINLDTIKQIKEVERGRIKEYQNYHKDAEYFERQNDASPIWNIKTDIALPCATQNELTLNSAKKLVANGVIAVGEGANMPTVKEGIEYFLQNNILFAPGKAANAGGVATSAIEMSQNSMRYYMTFEEVDKKLDTIMVNIFGSCNNYAEKYKLGNNYVAGGNMAAFYRLAEAIKAQGFV